MTDAEGSTDTTTASTSTVAADGTAAEDGTTAAPAGSWVRTFVAIVLGTLAMVGLVISTVSVWARTTLSDSDEVASIAASTLEQPEIREELAAYLVGQLTTAVDVEGFVDDRLPEQLGPLSPILVGGLEERLEEGVAAMLATPEANEILERTVRRAHEATLRLLRGDGLVDGVTVTGGDVSVNLLPLLGRGVGWVQDRGLLTDVDMPELTLDGDPEVQIAELEESLDRDLPEDFGQLVVYHSERVDQASALVSSAQRTVVVARRAMWLVIATTIVLAVASVLVARSRRRALLVVSLASLATVAVTRLIVQRVVAEAPQLVARPAQQAALVNALTQAVSGLLKLLVALALVALVLVVLAIVRSGDLRRDVATTVGVVAGIAVVTAFEVSLATLVGGAVVGVVVAMVVNRLPIPTTWPTGPSGSPPPIADGGGV